ncbi:MAG TPA: MFS transporter [Anaerolineales bacterium]|nr:MFS transporter [Anaerolineales bacterium]
MKSIPHNPEADSMQLSQKWRVLLLLSLAELLAMGTWFSASATVSSLSAVWDLTESGRAWLTMSVQVGFVAGSLLSAIFNIADRVRSHRLFAATALLSAICTALIPLAESSFLLVLTLRFFTGFFLVGVYPVGMKIMSTWTKEDRGFGIGLLVGALTLGTASPHLLNTLAGMENWKMVLLISAGLSALGSIIALLFLKEGPYASAKSKFNWRYAAKIFKQRELWLANLGYLGHMWELFAMWAWLSAFLIASFAVSGIESFWANLATFFILASGGVGSLIAGKLADQIGRTTLTIISLVISGLCCLVVGFLFGANPVLLLVVCLIWGFAIIPDSAQYSAAISELCQREYIGTALTMQTSLGFLLTLVTIRLIPTIQNAVGWRWAFAFLAIGPAVGIYAMAKLRTLPEAVKMANGNR